MNKLITTSLASSLLIVPALFHVNAFEQPAANDLVGKLYGGLHVVLMSADDDRLDSLVPSTDFDGGDGFGVEVGYRYSPEIEFRLAYTDLTFELENGHSDEDGSALSLDTLYFINQKNLYLLGGLNNLDIENTDISANVGIGYRHYFNNNFAVYLEGKGHYQFDDNYMDYSTQIGLTYFFGDVSSSPVAQVKEQPPVQAIPAKSIQAPLDSDKDGIVDAQDDCVNTPMEDKVDANGCTIFSEEKLTQRLLINFGNNLSVIEPEYYDDIERIARFLTKYPQVNITIAGHTSSQGSASYNQTLSQKRADAVVTLLVEKYNVEAQRLMAVGYGESKLINTANTSAAHEENRRIEALVEVKSSVPVAR